MGLPLRETRIGALSSACGRRARFANAQALLAISDFRYAASRTAGAWLQSQTRLRDPSLRLPSPLRGGLNRLPFSYRFAIVKFY